MRRVSVFFIALGVFMLPTAAFAVEDEAPEPVHIALGDSVAFGVGTPNEAQLSYSAVLSRWARSVDCQGGGSRACPGLKLVNLAVPGATSSTLITDRLPTALEMISERNRDASPHNDVVLVTLTIGGNDLYTPVISQCAGGVTPTCVETIQGVFKIYSQNLAVILGSLRATAGDDVKIVVMTYYNPLGSCFLASLEPLGNLVLEGDGGSQPGFNDIIRATAAAFNVSVADTFGQLEADDFVGGEDCLHPDTSGHKQIASIFLDVID